jgi:hypothetical protein
VIRKATRQGVRPIISLYSESGCGKTYSSLLLARGFVGPSGKIVMADSEEGRGELYADVIPGGYDVVPMTPPFSPQTYVAAIEEIENSGASIGIIDSGSHEWAGIGGVLDMASENEDKSGRAGLHNWKVPKFEHAKFVQKLLRAKIPLIICLRAKFKTRQGKDERGKTVVIKDDHTEPIQADDFIFESTCHGEVMPDHSFRLTKCSHPDLRKCFPSEGPITSHHGELLAQWCAAPSAKPTANPAKAKLWALTKDIHKGDVAKLETWLKAQSIISRETFMPAIQPDEWPVILEKAEIAISDVMP